MTVFYVFLAIVIPAALFFAVLYICYCIAFRRGATADSTVFISKNPRRDEFKAIIKKGREYIDSKKFEPVWITSHDGLRLFGKYYSAENPRGAVVLMHGYRSKAESDFSCALESFLESGVSVLLADQRTHGKSEGKAISFGILERHDCARWAQFLYERFPSLPIILEGMSMGSATVLSAVDLELPSTVCGVIADCGYSSAQGIIKKVIADMKLPVSVCYPAVRLAGLIFGSFDIEESSPLKSLPKNKYPLLLVHGEADTFVPVQMSRENFNAAAGEKTLVTVPGAGHGFAYLEDTPKVHAALSGFVDTVLQR